jgi:VanZ family protein
MPSIRRLSRIALYASSAMVGVLSLAPSTTFPPVSINDKIEHVVAYALLGILGAVSFECGALRTIIGLAAFGISLELLQAFSPGRSPELADALADVVGACLGYGALIALRRACSGKLAPRGTRSRAPNAGEGNHMASGSPSADAPLSD